ncbi:MAG: VOC family protein [Cryobacterium sp.]|nr:VOC family protein [Cryobacterium sp.]
MIKTTHAFSSFSVNDLAAAKEFYANKLGLTVADGEMAGTLVLRLPDGHEVFLYEKPDHLPATFTVLNLVVENIEAAVDALNAVGVVTKIYDDPDFGTDARGIVWSKAAGYGPDIAWFRDPAGNVISVLAE